MTLFKKSPLLRGKLKGALTDLSVDVFGYEKLVSRNFISNTRAYAGKLQVPMERLSLKILQKNNVVRAFLYDQKRAKIMIPPDHLIHFFIDEATVRLSTRDYKIADNIKEYLTDFAKEHKQDIQTIRIKISVRKCIVNVVAFKNETFIKEIPLSSLIKYFKK